MTDVTRMPVVVIKKDQSASDDSHDWQSSLILVKIVNN